MSTTSPPPESVAPDPDTTEAASELIYLDNAATTFPKPAEVHEKMCRFYRDTGVNPGRSGSYLAFQAEEMVLSTRRKLSALFNGSLERAGIKKDPNRLVFTANATHALNLILQGTVRAGDHILTTVLEHNSVIRPVNHLIRRGAAATFLRPDPDGRLNPEALARAIGDKTRLVIVNHGSNVTGAVQDLAPLGKVCEAAGVFFAVDASQTAGVVDIDMAAAGIDFLAFTGHKGLMGPTGTGGLCVADDAEIAPTLWGGTGVRSVEPFHPEEYPYRLEAGTLNLLGIAGLSAGCDWLMAQGIDRLHRREMELLARLESDLAQVPGVTLHGAQRLDRRVAVCSFTIAGWDPADVGTFLEVEHHVVARTGLHCAPLAHEHLGTAPRGTVRLSIGPFNTEAHVDAVIRGIAAIAAEHHPGVSPSR